ncbi:MAG: hypothetical protein HC835_08560 [Oscillatoriales cyanobacterium RM2_1_1]|nr:hypothetical protein [Oscillatoriales cyanobacterium SM2_3_0]NJO45670.1 hypothetical protein [Oscillatoriales cyanobacterium RM2_1_1]
MSKRLHLTLPDIVVDGLEEWSELEGTKPASLGAFIVETAVKEAMEKGIIRKPQHRIRLETLDTLKALLEREPLTQTQISDLADRLSVSESELRQIIEQLGQ